MPRARKIRRAAERNGTGTVPNGVTTADEWRVVRNGKWVLPLPSGQKVLVHHPELTDLLMDGKLSPDNLQGADESRGKQAIAQIVKVADELLPHVVLMPKVVITRAKKLPPGQIHISDVPTGDKTAIVLWFFGDENMKKVAILQA